MVTGAKLLTALVFVVFAGFLSASALVELEVNHRVLRPWQRMLWFGITVFLLAWALTFYGVR